MLFRQNKPKQPNQKRKIKLPGTALFAYLLIAVVLTTTVSFSRYTTTTSGSDGARVAAFVFDVNDKTSSITDTLGAIKVPGDSKTYTFTITNQRPDRVSEVTETYSMTFTALGSLPLTYILTDVTEGANNMVIYSDTAVLAGNASNAETGTFTAAVSAEKTYQLVVSWPEGENDIKYASGSGIASLQVTFQAEQVE